MGKHIYDEYGNYKGKILSDKEHNRKREKEAKEFWEKVKNKELTKDEKTSNHVDYTFGGLWLNLLIFWLVFDCFLMILDVFFEFLPPWYPGIDSDFPWGMFVMPFLLTCCYFWKQLYFLLKKYIKK